ncbi:MAG: LysE family transporter [Candidatus Pacebacteria bacterium]|nr:LysE family transporter [Candidatus Paceibacterota bacterium]
MKIFKNGLFTGLVLQLAIGPVFIFIINLTLQKTALDGLVATLGATFADYIYITLAIFGIGKLLEKEKVKRIFGIISSFVLIIFGIFIIKNIFTESVSINPNINSISLLSSFIYTFFLTLSSPLTIFLWTSLFTAKAMEYNYSKKELLVFGFSTGLATFVFIGTFVIVFSFIKGTIPMILIQALNLIVGLLLIVYGGIRLGKVLLANKS